MGPTRLRNHDQVVRFPWFRNRVGRCVEGINDEESGDSDERSAKWLSRNASPFPSRRAGHAWMKPIAKQMPMVQGGIDAIQGVGRP